MRMDAEVLHCLLKQISVSRLDLCQRSAERSDFPAHQVQGCLHRDRVDLAEESAAQRERLQLHAAAFFCIAVQILVNHVVHICRRYVGENGDHSDPAEGQERDDLVVIS